MQINKGDKPSDILPAFHEYSGHCHQSHDLIQLKPPRLIQVNLQQYEASKVKTFFVIEP
jgi:hypothetical protein